MSGVDQQQASPASQSQGYRDGRCGALAIAYKLLHAANASSTHYGRHFRPLQTQRILCDEKPKPSFDFGRHVACQQSLGQRILGMLFRCGN